MCQCTGKGYEYETLCTSAGRIQAAAQLEAHPQGCCASSPPSLWTVSSDCLHRGTRRGLLGDAHPCFSHPKSPEHDICHRRACAALQIGSSPPTPRRTHLLFQEKETLRGSRGRKGRVPGRQGTQGAGGAPGPRRERCGEEGAGSVEPGRAVPGRARQVQGTDGGSRGGRGCGSRAGRTAAGAGEEAPSEVSPAAKDRVLRQQLS